jgi:transposase
LMGSGAALSRAVEPDYARVHIELRRKGVTLMLLWGEYRAAHEGQRTWAYTQFCGHYKAFAKTLFAGKVSVRKNEGFEYPKF